MAKLGNSPPSGLAESMVAAMSGMCPLIVLTITPGVPQGFREGGITNDQVGRAVTTGIRLGAIAQGLSHGIVLS